jgi:superfamily II DNA or RNA helicase
MTLETLADELRDQDLLPHQVEFIMATLALEPRGRMLLADAVGLGKTRACAGLIWAWARIHGRKPRTLVLAPRPLLSRWQAELADYATTDCAIVDAARFRHLEARTRADENPWAAIQIALTSVDFVKRDQRLQALLEVPWDIVILDEAHLGGPWSQRGQALLSLWASQNVCLMVAASATPGTAVSTTLDASPDVPTRVLRRLARDLVDWDGRALLGDEDNQIVEVVQIELSSQERDVLKEVQGLSQVAPDDPEPPLVMFNLVDAAASSMFAFDSVLRRAIVRVDLADIVLNQGVQALPFDSRDAFTTREAAQRYSLARERFERLAELVDLVEVDTKWKVCEEVLRSGLSRSGEHAILFTDFPDTAHYVAGMLREAGDPVELVTGASSLAERERAEESFRRNRGVIVLTSAAAEGFGFSFVKLCVHYDVPWNPTTFAQRLGRVRRLGAPPGPVRHVLFADGVLRPSSLIRKLFAFQQSEDVAGAEALRIEILEREEQN